MLIYKWRCDASRALEVAHQRCLQYQALLKVIIIDLLNDKWKRYSLPMLLINHKIQIKHKYIF